MRTAPLLFVTLLSAFVAAAYAHSKDAHSHERAEGNQGDSLSAHQHGVAALNLIVDGDVVEIELASPADNLIGFEYLPSNAADIQTVKDAMAFLGEPQRLFAFPAAAGCASTKVELKSPIFEAVAASDPDPDPDHGHGQQPDDHHHDHSKHAADHDDSKTHHDIEAHYRFACDNTAALNQVEVTLFEAFPNTEKLILQAIGDHGQQGGELTPASNLIRF